MPKVLHVCETAKGGIGTYVNTLCKITSDRYINSVIAPDIHRNVLSASLDVQEFRHSGRGTGTLVRLAWATLAGIFRSRPDIVFFHSSFALFPMALARCVFWWKPFIYCAHGWADGRETLHNSTKQNLIRIIEGTLGFLATAVVNVSKSDLAIAKSNSYLGRQILIENAIAPSRSTSVRVSRRPSEEINILFVGRLDYQKGFDVLLAAFEKIISRRNDIKLDVVGEGVLEKAHQFSDFPNVNYHGWVSHDKISEFFENADLTIIPSRWEAFGLVAVESLSHGTPICVSDRGELPNIVGQNGVGFVFNLSDARLSEILLELDLQSLIAMRPACIDLFNRRYHADRLKTEIESLYGELLT